MCEEPGPARKKATKRYGKRVYWERDRQQSALPGLDFVGPAGQSHDRKCSKFEAMSRRKKALAGFILVVYGNLFLDNERHARRKWIVVMDQQRMATRRSSDLRREGPKRRFNEDGARLAGQINR